MTHWILIELTIAIAAAVVGLLAYWSQRQRRRQQVLKRLAEEVSTAFTELPTWFLVKHGTHSAPQWLIRRFTVHVQMQASTLMHQGSSPEYVLDLLVPSIRAMPERVAQRIDERMPEPSPFGAPVDYIPGRVWVEDSYE